MPSKFSIDKRKTEYSALIRSGQKTREEALAEVTNNEYPYDEEIVRYTICKLALNREEFDEIFMRKVRSFKEFSSYYPIIRSFKLPIKVAASLGIVPRILYLKYAK